MKTEVLDVVIVAFFLLCVTPRASQASSSTTSVSTKTTSSHTTKSPSTTTSFTTTSFTTTSFTTTSVTSTSTSRHTRTTSSPGKAAYIWCWWCWWYPKCTVCTSSVWSSDSKYATDLWNSLFSQ
uniref:Microfilarial sheath protein SHP3a n=1 Tax=Litomosoides sigmodontis TaxID=42156 RepID=Q25401_LITSI|nr:microfilarial sheath protein SHP3a [Litomosoides sigmodontis]